MFVARSLLVLLTFYGIIKDVLTQESEGSFDQTCSLYLAETMNDRGAPTMGVFTTKPLAAGQHVGLSDVVIPLIDIPIHNSPTHEDQQEFWWVWHDLVWDTADVGGTYEGVDVKSASLGLGSLTRGNPERANVIMLQSQVDNAGLDRTRDPGAGAISYYNKAEMVTTEAVEAGSELHFHHGFHWTLDPHDQESSLLHTLPENDPRVQEFWRHYTELNQSSGEALTGELRSELWRLLGEFPTDSTIDRILSGSWTDSDGTKTQITKYTPEWLAKNGICLDNIRQGPSDIPQAGRGAFATRPLSADSVIAPAPLAHIVDKKALNMYAPHVDESFMYTMSEDVVNKQLLINYCFGHPESTKLLCPIGTGTPFINHSPTPNAAIRWSTHSSSGLHKAEWLNMTIEELGKKMDIGLMIEYFALRNIKANEEITINYGDEWEKAWDQHITEWQPPDQTEMYVSAEEMNSDPDNWFLMTVAEQEESPYPSSVVTSCVYDHIEGLGLRDNSGTYANPAEFDVIVKGWEPIDENSLEFMFLRPCIILARSEKATSEVIGDSEVSYEYVVQILNSDQIHDEQKIPDFEMLLVEGFPRDSIRFTDFFYSSDMHIRNSFRMEMTMPDGLFPQSWRNMKQ